MTGRDAFAVAVRHVGIADLVSVRGELDLYTAPRLREALSDNGQGQAPHLILDLSSLSFLDASGVGTIDAGRRLRADRGGRTIVVARQGTMVHKILDILGLHKVMEIVPDLQDATRSIDVDHEASRP